MRKILIISDVPTHKTNAGNRSCILSYSNMLKELGHEVYFLFYSGHGFEKYDIIDSKKFWGKRFFHYELNLIAYLRSRFYYYYRFKILKSNFYKVDDLYPNGIEKMAKEIVDIHDISVVISNYIWTSKVFLSLPNVKKILYTHDMFSKRFEHTGMSFFSTSVIQEGLALERADTIISIQDKETTFFKNITSKKVLTGFSPSKLNILPLSFNKNILFFGGGNELNIEGINSFIKNIFPKIIQQDKSINLLIGGGICDHLNINYHSNIDLLGYFNNLKDFYKQGDIVINPVSHGTGLKIKTIEALSHGKIVVSRHHGVEGLFDIANAPIVKVCNESEYINSVLDLLGNKNKILEYHLKSISYIKRYNAHIESVFTKAIMD